MPWTGTRFGSVRDREIGRFVRGVFSFRFLFFWGGEVSDVTLSAITSALGGLAERQRVIADNTANIQTQSFLAGQVNFEDSLQQTLAGGSDPSSVGPTISRSLDPTRPNGNNVSLDEQTLLGMDTTLRYQLMLRAADDKFGQLRDVLRGS